MSQIDGDTIYERFSFEKKKEDKLEGIVNEAEAVTPFFYDDQSYNKRTMTKRKR